MADLTIGALAHAAGVGVETVRFYQRKGLVAVPARAGAIRRYDVRDVERVAVDQHRVAASRRGDAQLIHDAGGHSGGAVLGSLPEQRELDR